MSLAGFYLLVSAVATTNGAVLIAMVRPSASSGQLDKITCVMTLRRVAVMSLTVHRMNCARASIPPGPNDAQVGRSW
jgi:hypothetical protein